MFHQQRPGAREGNRSRFFYSNLYIGLKQLQICYYVISV